MMWSWKADEAIAFIREHEPPDGYFVGFSGGKDSIVTLDLVRRSGVQHQAFCSWTGLEPWLLPFLREHYPDVTILRPKIRFWQLVERKGPATRLHRWCCDYLKKSPSKSIPLKHRIFGIRAEESPKRKQGGRLRVWEKNIHYHPIFDWSSDDIWCYIEDYNLSYPSLYDEGIDRLGCVVCPFLTNKKLEQSVRRYPGYFRKYRSSAHIYWLTRKTHYDSGCFEEWYQSVVMSRPICRDDEDENCPLFVFEDVSTNLHESS